MRRNAGVKESKLLCIICGPGQCARMCGGGTLWRDSMEARPTLKQQACPFCPQWGMPPLIPAPSDKARLYLKEDTKRTFSFWQCQYDTYFHRLQGWERDSCTLPFWFQKGVHSAFPPTWKSTFFFFCPGKEFIKIFLETNLISWQLSISTYRIWTLCKKFKAKNKGKKTQFCFIGAHERNREERGKAYRRGNWCGEARYPI